MKAKGDDIVIYLDRPYWATRIAGVLFLLILSILLGYVAYECVAMELKNGRLAADDDSLKMLVMAPVALPVWWWSFKATRKLVHICRKTPIVTLNAGGITYRDRPTVYWDDILSMRIIGCFEREHRIEIVTYTGVRILYPFINSGEVSAFQDLGMITAMLRSFFPGAALSRKE